MAAKRYRGPSTACSTVTPATSRADGSARAARPGRWPGARRTARPSSPASGPRRSSRRWAGCGARASRALPRPARRGRDAHGVHRRRRRRRPAARQRPALRRAAARAVRAAAATRCSRSPARAGPTVTSRPTTSFSTGERLVLIDWPQIVDVIGNPSGMDFLARDATTMARWFTAKGYAVDDGRAHRRPRRRGDVALVEPRWPGPAQVTTTREPIGMRFCGPDHVDGRRCSAGRSRARRGRAGRCRRAVDGDTRR